MAKEILYGKTPLGQKLYDFGFSKVSEKWLARKYGMSLATVRDLRTRIKNSLKPKRKRRALSRPADSKENAK